MGTKRVYLKQSVYDAAIERIEWLFSEFPNVIVNVSGGKDSTVVLNLTLSVAERLGRLPLDVMFIDQEVEWASVIEHVRDIMSDPRVRPHWLQMPVDLENAASADEPMLTAWEPGRAWVREKEPDSIHENDLGVQHFSDIFDAYLARRFPNEPATYIAGVRTEESPARLLGLTTYATYKGETWGRIGDKARGHYTFYPIYDWGYTDVWKAIHDHAWPYCRLYDEQYRYGINVRDMRVSNVNHETALKNLFYLQEVEPDTWERITARLRGLNSVAHLQGQFFTPRELPPMFRDWTEYRDHLVDNLITDPEHQQWFRETFAAYDARYDGDAKRDLIKTEISMVLVNDRLGTKLKSFVASHMHSALNRGKRSGRTQDHITP